jgi:Peptidase family S41/N-terminal domain of Peptidase_S41 in eukaryotic IRBP
VDQTEIRRVERMVDRELRARFPPGSVRRVALFGPGDDERIGPGEVLVRVVIEAPGEPGDPQRSLDEWAQAHERRMRQVRRELSFRLPEARLLEFTAGEGAGAPTVAMPHDPAAVDEPMSTDEIVTIALQTLRTSYVFPERAEQAAAAVQARLAAGEYQGLDENALAERLTEHLNEVCEDKHLRVRAMSPRHARRRAAVPDAAPPSRPEPGRPDGKRHPGNYGIQRVDRLAGNVGYLDLHGVAQPDDEAGAAIAAAMRLVSGTYALIIDLRNNHGGSPHGVAFWCSFLFPGAETRLTDIFTAETGETRQFWTLPYVPGPRYLDRPVYVLTSHETFSGGEDLCYSLQAQGRAEVIGETTGGGAHPTRPIPISATMMIGVPFARSVNAITGTNWQGTGVVPDVAVPAADAYDVAYGQALRHVLSSEFVPPPVADEAREALAALPAATAG